MSMRTQVTDLTAPALMFAGAWWVTVIPGLVLVLLLISVNVLGDGLRDRLDPRRRWSQTAPRRVAGLASRVRPDP